MVVLGLILLAILLSLILQRKVHKQPYARDRPPLVPLQKRTSPMSVYSSGETHPGLADTKIPGAGSPTSNRSVRMGPGGRRPSQGQLSRTYSPTSLHRSVSQLLDLYDKKTFEESPWDAILHNHRTTGRGLVRAPASLGLCCASPARDLSVLLESYKGLSIKSSWRYSQKA